VLYLMDYFRLDLQFDRGLSTLNPEGTQGHEITPGVIKGFRQALLLGEPGA
jgi:hypothetical protein